MKNYQNLITLIPVIFFIGVIYLFKYKSSKKIRYIKPKFKIIRSQKDFLVSLVSLLIFFTIFRNIIDVKYMILYFLLLLSIVYFEEIK